MKMSETPLKSHKFRITQEKVNYSIINEKKLLERKKKQQTLGENFKNYSKMKEKGDVLKIEFKDFLKGRSNILKKIKILHIASSKIKNDLDVTNIMQKFQEVDKLKLILFSKETIDAFQFDCQTRNLCR